MMNNTLTTLAEEVSDSIRDEAYNSLVDLGLSPARALADTEEGLVAFEELFEGFDPIDEDEDES